MCRRLGQLAGLVAAQRLTRHPDPAGGGRPAPPGARSAGHPGQGRAVDRRGGRPRHGPGRAARGCGAQGVRGATGPGGAGPAAGGPRPLRGVALGGRPDRGRIRSVRWSGRHGSSGRRQDARVSTRYPRIGLLGDRLSRRGSGHGWCARVRAARGRPVPVPGRAAADSRQPTADSRQPTADSRLRTAGRHVLRRGGDGYRRTGRVRDGGRWAARLTGEHGSLVALARHPGQGRIHSPPAVRTRCGPRSRRPAVP